MRARLVAAQALLNLYRTQGEARDSQVHSVDAILRPIHIVDCRGRAAALGNRAQGKGTESVADYENATLKYCDIGNIHTMRESQQALVELLTTCDVGGKDDTSAYLIALEATGWLKHVQQVLRAAVAVAERLALEGASVLVHCSDGWDRTAQALCASAPGDSRLFFEKSSLQSVKSFHLLRY